MLPRLVADDPYHGGQAEPGHLAGCVAVRAPRPRRLAQAAHHAERLPARLLVHAFIARQPDGQHEQLGKELGAFPVQALSRQVLDARESPRV